MNWFAVSRNFPWPSTAITWAVQHLTTMTHSYLESHGHEFLEPEALPRAAAGLTPPYRGQSCPARVATRIIHCIGDNR